MDLTFFLFSEITFYRIICFLHSKFFNFDYYILLCCIFVLHIHQEIWTSLGDATSLFQKCITEGCKTKKSSSEWVTIGIKEADYPIKVLSIPDNCKVCFSSLTNSKISHINGEKKPLFILGKKSFLKLQNIEIKSKSKEFFLFRGFKKNPKNVFMKNVKIIRIKQKYLRSEATDTLTVDAVSSNQLLEFITKYVEAYRKEANSLIKEPPLGAGYPSSLVNRVYLDSRLIRAYLLNDAVVISDVIEHVSSEGFETDRSMEILHAKLSKQFLDGTKIEVVLVNHTLQNFISTATLGLFKIKAKESVNEFGKRNGLRKFLIKNSFLRKERYVSQIDCYHYLDKEGWEPRNAWIYAFYDVRYDIASTIATQEQVGKTYSVKRQGEIISTPTNLIWHEYDIKTKLGSKLIKFSKDIEDFEKLLIESGNSIEQEFLDYLDRNTHLLDIYAISIEPQPFIEIPEQELCTISGSGRFPDYIAKYSDDSYLLIELERPSKPIFVGKDNRQSHELTQSINQVATWDEIISCFGNYLKKYPGIRNHRNLVVIGRENSQKFDSIEEFNSELNRINRLYNGRISVITFDELVKRAKTAVSRIRAIQSLLG